MSIWGHPVPGDYEDDLRLHCAAEEESVEEIIDGALLDFREPAIEVLSAQPELTSRVPPDSKKRTHFELGKNAASNAPSHPWEETRGFVNPQRGSSAAGTLVATLLAMVTCGGIVGALWIRRQLKHASRLRRLIRDALEFEAQVTESATTEALQRRCVGLKALQSEAECAPLVGTAALHLLARAVAALQLQVRCALLTDRAQDLLADSGCSTDPRAVESGAVSPDDFASLLLELSPDSLAGIAPIGQLAAFNEMRAAMERLRHSVARRVYGAHRHRDVLAVARAARLAELLGDDQGARDALFLQQRCRRLEQERNDIVARLAFATAAAAEILAASEQHTAGGNAEHEEDEQQEKLAAALADADLYDLRRFSEYAAARDALRALEDRAVQQCRHRSARAGVVESLKLLDGIFHQQTPPLVGWERADVLGQNSNLEPAVPALESDHPAFECPADVSTGKEAVVTRTIPADAAGASLHAAPVQAQTDMVAEAQFKRGDILEGSSLTAQPDLGTLVGHPEVEHGTGDGIRRELERLAEERRLRRSRARQESLQRAERLDHAAEVQTREVHILGHMRAQSDATTELLILSRHAAASRNADARRTEDDRRQRRQQGDDSYLLSVATILTWLAAIVALAGGWLRLDAPFLGGAAYTALFRQCSTQRLEEGAHYSAVPSLLRYLVLSYFVGADPALLECRAAVLASFFWQGCIAYVYMFFAVPVAQMMPGLRSCGPLLPSSPVIWWSFRVLGLRKGVVSAIVWLLLPGAAMKVSGIVLHRIESASGLCTPFLVLRIGLPAAGFLFAVTCGLQIACAGSDDQVCIGRLAKGIWDLVFGGW